MRNFLKSVGGLIIFYGIFVLLAFSVKARVDHLEFLTPKPKVVIPTPTPSLNYSLKVTPLPTIALLPIGDLNQEHCPLMDWFVFLLNLKALLIISILPVLVLFILKKIFKINLFFTNYFLTLTIVALTSIIIFEILLSGQIVFRVSCL